MMHEWEALCDSKTSLNIQREPACRSKALVVQKDILVSFKEDALALALWSDPGADPIL